LVRVEDANLKGRRIFESFDLSPGIRDILAVTGSEVEFDFVKVNDPLTLTKLRLHRLTPYLYTLITALGCENSVSPPILQWLEDDYALALQQTLRQQREVREILQALHRHGIQVILLKGADLRLRLYDDPAARPMADLDLLISKNQCAPARQVLESLGFSLSPFCADPRPGFRQRFDHELFFMPPPGKKLGLDLHWEIWSEAGYYRLPCPDLHRRAEPLLYDGLPVKVLAPEHALIHLCLHLLEHPYALIQVLDLALLIRRLPIKWPFFLAEASHFQCCAPLGQVLSQLARLVPESVPPEIIVELSRVRPDFWERVILSERLGYLTEYLAVARHYSLREGLAYLAAKIWPETGYLAVTQGNPNWTAYFRQFFAKFRGRHSLRPRTK
jgi:hypothetical protein